MIAAPPPLDEAERLAALRACAVLDTAPEQATEDLVRLAATVADVPMALISLVDETRQWFKARVGVDLCETDRDLSFCAWSVLTRAPLLVPDARADDRFADNPLVRGEPFMRAYAGFPLCLESGHCIGTLCVLDTRPRTFDAKSLDGLERLARATVDAIENRHIALELRDALERVRVLEEMIPVCAWCRKIREDGAYQRTLEDWLESEAGTRISHGICPCCAVVAAEGDDGAGPSAGPSS